MRALFVPFLVLVTFSLLAQEPTPPAEARGKVDPAKRIEKLITDGLASWRAGDATKAAELLQRAVGLIQQETARNLAAFLPKEAAGWKLEEPDVSSGSSGTGEQSVQWTNAQVHATQEDGDASLDVQITNSPQLYQGYQAMVQTQQQLLSNPQWQAVLKQQGQEMAIADRNGFKVLTMVDKEHATAQAVGKSIAVRIEIDKGNRKMLDQALGWIDLEKLAKLDAK